jgi:hypothetical protein
MLAATTGAAAADLPAPVLTDTPLVLKDGRMAYVTVRTVPFVSGSDSLEPAIEEDLNAAIAELATECFLTAQAIGQVDPSVQAESDTLAAHRLARARAERVQKVLVDQGMPANTVAGVWDWQFLVREPRVTLWVFGMRPGEDCEGRPLKKVEPKVAVNPPAAATMRIEEEAEPAAEEEPHTVATGTTTASPEPEPAPAKVEEIRKAEILSAEASPTAGEAVPDDRETLVGVDELASRTTAALPPAERPEPAAKETKAPPVPKAKADPPSRSEPEPADMAAVQPAAKEEKPKKPARPPPLGSIELVFDNNSSYLPSGATRELRRWVDGLPREQGLKIALAAAVGKAEPGVVDPSKAARYGRWLAERRLGRVQEWLERNVDVRDLTFERRFLENDSSRRVVMEARPAP